MTNLTALSKKFVRSIMAGIEDVEKGRVHEVPEGQDAVEFLRKLIDEERKSRH
jgi:hypothetical protein